MNYEKETFTNVIVELDDHEFIGCHFEDCELVYTGGLPPVLYGCSFIRPRWTFAGAAENTVRFMADLYGTCGEQGRRLIEETFENIRRGWREELPH